MCLFTECVLASFSPGSSTVAASTAAVEKHVPQVTMLPDRLCFFFTFHHRKIQHVQTTPTHSHWSGRSSACFVCWRIISPDVGHVYEASLQTFLSRAEIGYSLVFLIDFIILKIAAEVVNIYLLFKSRFVNKITVTLVNFLLHLMVWVCFFFNWRLNLILNKMLKVDASFDLEFLECISTTVFIFTFTLQLALVW